MEVRGTLWGVFNIAPEDAIYELARNFAHDEYKNNTLGTCRAEDRDGVKGVYFEGILIYEGEEAIEVLNALKVLKNLYCKVIEEAKEKSAKLERQKRR